MTSILDELLFEDEEEEEKDFNLLIDDKRLFSLLNEMDDNLLKDLKFEEKEKKNERENIEKEKKEQRNYQQK